MRCLVTGVAGFVGSHLAERLVRDGHDVLGVDRFTEYYPRANKEDNLAGLGGHARFALREVDLAEAEIGPLVRGADVVFHQAAQPGVRASWGTLFEGYVRDNVLATQRLLEACKQASTPKVVYASSSSVYGDTPDLPMRETSATRPFSPYGVTKLAAEHLCELYRTNFGLPTISLRYFTVYGPRQRPDMAFRRFIDAMLRGERLPLFGDGEQTRDFTFVADAVEANVLAMQPGKVGVYNIGGGTWTTMREVLSTLEALTGRPALVDRKESQAGDVRHTRADTTAARTALGFAPRVSLRDGLAAQVEWQKAGLSA